jgi:hypothetical protein
MQKVEQRIDQTSVVTLGFAGETIQPDGEMDILFTLTRTEQRISTL